HLVQRVVVEETGGACGNAVLQVEVHRLGGDRLTDGHGVAFAGELGNVNTREAVEQLCGVRRAGAPYLFAIQNFDGGRCVVATLHLSCGTHHGGREDGSLRREAEVEARGVAGRDTRGE